MINQNFSQQILSDKAPEKMSLPNPFADRRMKRRTGFSRVSLPQVPAGGTCARGSYGGACCCR